MKLFIIYLSCSVLYFKIFVKRFVHIYAEALYKYCLLLLLLWIICNFILHIEQTISINLQRLFPYTALFKLQIKTFVSLILKLKL